VISITIDSQFLSFDPSSVGGMMDIAPSSRSNINQFPTCMIHSLVYEL